MAISDAVSRVSAIDQQLQQLQDGTLLSSVLGGSGASTDTGSTTSTSGSSSDFSDELAAAQATTTSDAAAAGTTATDATTGVTGTDTGVTGTDDSTGTSDVSSLESELLSALTSGDTTSTGTSDYSSSDSALLSSLTASAGTSSGTTLPAGAQSLLTSGQQQFATTLSAQTGLSPSVVSAWLLAEESGSAAQSRQAQGNNDWLNIGYTDSGTVGASDAIWSDPVTAADATAAWLQGQDSIPGYGTASAGVQSILDTVGETPAAQIAALQDSGWSSSGYSSLPELYGQVTA